MRSNLRSTILGFADFYRFPELRSSWGGPFNGQRGRTTIFEAIVRLQLPLLILETGTFHGTTTEILANFAPEVITIESDPRAYGFAKARLRRRRNVTLLLGDSRTGLHQALSARALQESGSTLAYLDAHWNDDLPLAEELDIVFNWDPAAIVMIDDFQVPLDSGYAFDNYDVVLNASYIAPVVGEFGLAQFYPALPSSEETGMKRGCVVLAQQAVWADSLLETGLLWQA